MGDHLKLKNGAILFCCTCCECPECYERKGQNCDCEPVECSECQSRNEEGCCVDPECGPCQHIEDGCCVDNEEPCCGEGETLNSEGECVPYAGKTCQTLGYPPGYTFNSNYVCVLSEGQTCQDLGFPEGYEFVDGYCTDGTPPPPPPCGSCNYLGSYVPSSVRLDFVVSAPPPYCNSWYCVPAFCGSGVPEPLVNGEAWTGYTILSTNGVCSTSEGPIEQNGFSPSGSFGMEVVPCEGNCGFKLFVHYQFQGMLWWGDSICIKPNMLVIFQAKQDICGVEMGTYEFSGVWELTAFYEDPDYTPTPYYDISSVTITLS